MARVTGVGKGPEFPEGKEPTMSSKLATNVGKADSAAKDTWLYQGYSDLADRVTVGLPPGQNF